MPNGGADYCGKRVSQPHVADAVYLRFAVIEAGIYTRGKGAGDSPRNALGLNHRLQSRPLSRETVDGVMYGGTDDTSGDGFCNADAVSSAVCWD
ncbi:MAG: hypothetical protein LBF87_03465 [Treponema sp.]|nr:hypothetical protein [Treponema sp.]